MEGIEPSLVEPESTVLPLDDIPNVIKMAGSAGFEPTNAGTKTLCLATWRRPSIIILTEINGGEERIRTSGPD